jgi:hypothetical protein
MSETPAGGEKTKNVKERSRNGMSRRKVLTVAIVALSMIGFVAATFIVPVSKLTITVVNYSGEDIQYRVYVDDFEDRAIVLEPTESLTFSWKITGWLHRYDIIAYPASIKLPYWVHSWTNIIVLPFSEKVITNERQHGERFAV